MTESDISRNEVPLEPSIPEGGVSLESILCTEELRRRQSRPPDYKKETHALVALVSALADSPRTVLQTLAETILEVTQSDSSGLSLLTTDGKRFYWPAIAGRWKPHIGGGTPRDFGPCGDVLDRNIPLLFRHFERRYPYLQPVMPSAEECLLVPFYVGGKAVGTIWAIMHDGRRKLDAEDERLMSALGKFASSAYQTLASIDDLKFQMARREKVETALRELTDALETRVRVRTEELEQEVAERKGAEEELRRSEAYLAEAQRLSLTGSFGWRVVTGELVWSAETFCIMGVDQATKPTLELVLRRVHPEDVNLVQHTIDHATRDGTDFDFEHRLLMPDGRVKHVHVVARAVKAGSSVVEFVGAVMDITERKQAQEAMRAATARFEGILDIAEDAIISVDSNQRIVLFNQGAEKVFDYVAGDVLGQPLDILLPQRFAPVHRGHIEAFSKAPEVSRLMGQRREVFGRRKDGSEFPAEASISRLDLGGEMVFTVILRDITERKRAERRLVAQHTVTQMLAETATLEEATPKILQAVCECLVWDLGELWRLDRVAGVLRCVEVWHKASVEVPHFEAISRDLTFLPGIGLPGRVWSSREPVYLPDVVQDSHFLRASIAAREGLHAAFGFPILLGGEVVGVMDFFSREIRQPDQDLLDMMATIGSQIGQFIERKRAEEELRRSEFYLNEGQRVTHTGSWACDPSGFSDYWSPELFQIYGLDPVKGPPTLAQYLARIHPQDRGSMAETVERMLATGSGCDVKKRIVRPDGAVRQVRCVGVPVFDGGVLKGFVGTAMDVTEQEELTQQLRRRQAYLAEAQRLSHTGSFGWSVASGEIFWSDETFHIFEYDRETKPTLELVLQRVHPDDKALVQEVIDHASRDGNDFNFENRLLLPDGSVRNVHVVAHALRDESGSVEFVGAVMDVTPAKEARATLEKAFKEIETLKDQLYKENIALREEVDKASMFEEIVGASPPLKGVLARVSKVAPTDSTVLITGETGTGKELIARAIHKGSRRSSRMFVSVNCAAIPAALVASELFGHEKGAFTGAFQRRIGRFELAEGGTIFLDEIGELPPETQIALLRVLQEGEFDRVGGTQPIRSDVRLIAATNRDLKAALASGTFRSDLFYRLNVFPVEVPPLRARQEDIPLLTEYFIHRYASKMGKKISGISKQTLARFQSYSWPGNIRELQNVIERSVVVSETETFAADESWLARQPLETETPLQPLAHRLATDEKALIEATLAETRGRVSGPSGAAVRLGMPASTLESKIRILEINKHRFKTV